MPAKTAVTMPDMRLGGKKEGAKKSPTIPPKSVDNMPRYGPRIIPIIGAVIAAKVMAPPCKPTIGKAGMKEKYVYKAVKHMSKATSLVVSLLFLRMLVILLHCVVSELTG
ncbi:MAG: hypothetical protein QMD13_05435 [Candidatus Bathyarchaeia archaeon]|nr:hypothetical protein [Candidatus Bathyarchaeia archaeon]